MSIDKAKEEARKRKTKPARKVKGARPKAVKAWAVWYPDTGLFATQNGRPMLWDRRVESANGDGWVSIPVRIVPLPPKRKASK